MHNIIFRNPAIKFLKKLDKNIQRKIISKIDSLKDIPRIGKPLTGNLKGLWRLRYDQFRIIYKINDTELKIYVLDIGNRDNIYK
jgi:mRNA interferase RelE/StbE